MTRTAKFRGFYFQLTKTTEMARKNESDYKVTTKRIHYALFIGILPTRVVTLYSHSYLTMKTGQQSSSGQHQQLRCFGIQTEIKTRTINSEKQSHEQRIKRRGKMLCEPEFLTTEKFSGFHFQLKNNTAREFITKEN